MARGQRSLAAAVHVVAESRTQLSDCTAKTKTSNLLDKEFKVMIIEMLKELGRIDAGSQKSNDGGENKKNQADLKNAIKISKRYKNKKHGKDAAVDEMTQRDDPHRPEDKTVRISQAEQNKGKKHLEMRIV